jgi:hypothetical protein
VHGLPVRSHRDPTGGERIKTNRRDARKLVRLFRAGELTAVQVPDEAEESVRDLLRCRDAVRRDVMRWRHRTRDPEVAYTHTLGTGLPKNCKQRRRPPIGHRNLHAH